MCMLLSFSFMWTFLSFFSKKIVSLLSLEGLMLLVIIFFQTTSVNHYSIILLIVLSIFMVLDSVFGITLLISSSRSSFLTSKNFN